MLPTRGTCHGIFLLTHSARTGRRRSLGEWVSYAKSMPTLMAAAIDLDQIAHALCRLGLATLEADTVVLNRRLAAVDGAASEEVLLTIAAIVLSANAPPWVHASMSDDRLCPEYIPAGELASLSWLGDDLEPLIAGVKRQTEVESAFKLWLGAAGESLVVAMERSSGALVRHVSSIGDYFGYDVESLREQKYRFEVKTSVLGGDHRFFITRNEVSVAKRYPAEWFIVQVVFKSEVMTLPLIGLDHIHTIKLLDSVSLTAILPSDSAQSRWIETAEVKTAGLPWLPYAPVKTSQLQWRYSGYNAPVAM